MYPSQDEFVGRLCIMYYDRRKYNIERAIKSLDKNEPYVFGLAGLEELLMDDDEQEMLNKQTLIKKII